MVAQSDDWIINAIGLIVKRGDDSLLQRKSLTNREEWIAQRAIQGIGGSDAAAVVGMSPWMTPMQLWQYKTGQARQKELSGNSAVEQGNRMEPILRDFFSVLHPEYQVDYHQFDILFQAERPWLFATLDGELVREQVYPASLDDANAVLLANGYGGGEEYVGSIERIERGILEIKTATPNGKLGWAKWSNGAMPQNYYIQVLHELLATGFDFVILFACLYSQNGDMTLKTYEIERVDVEEDMAWLLQQETDFYRNCIVRGKMPSMPITL